MKKVRGTKCNKFHDELGGAIPALANSAKIAVKRAALRNNAAMMSDAEFCRPTDDFRIRDCNRASLMPELPLTEHDTWVRANDTDDTDGTWATSDSFERAEEKYVEPKGERVSEVSFMQPILKLYDQLGGFIKR
jgi:hypothetical protein